MKQFHPIQLLILRKLLFSPTLRYLELKPDPEMENNQFNFHLDQMIKIGYVQKEEINYFLTESGKEYAGRMDTDKTIISKQAKISAWVCCTKKFKGKLQHLIYTRLKQPFYGCQGFLSGKVAFGEKVVEAAKRELTEETGLVGNPEIVLLRHYRVFDRSGEQLLEDKMMFLCLVAEPQGNLQGQNEEGKYEWVDENKLMSYVTNPFESTDHLAKLVENINRFKGQVSIEEIDEFSNKF